MTTRPEIQAPRPAPRPAPRSPAPLAGALLLLAGCGGPDADTDPAPIEVSPYIFEEDPEDVPSADLTPDRIAAALEIGVARVLDVGPEPVFSAYDQAMTGQEGSCPDYYEDQGNTYWFDDCTSGAGTAFSGYGYTLAYDAYEDPDSGYTFDGRGLYAAATVRDAGGHTFSGAGSAYAIFGRKGPERYDQLVVQGTFLWDGPGVEGTWIEEGVAPDFYAVVYSHDDAEGGLVAVEGGLSPLSPDGGADTDPVAVVFEGVQLMSEGLGSTCPEEPTGSVSVRTRDGRWVDVLFDGSVEAAVPAEDCDGCGAAWYRGEPIGEVCADFTPLFRLLEPR